MRLLALAINVLAIVQLRAMNTPPNSESSNVLRSGPSSRVVDRPVQREGSFSPGFLRDATILYQPHAFNEMQSRRSILAAGSQETMAQLIRKERALLEDIQANRVNPSVANFLRTELSMKPRILEGVRRKVMRARQAAAQQGRPIVIQIPAHLTEEFIDLGVIYYRQQWIQEINRLENAGQVTAQLKAVKDKITLDILHERNDPVFRLQVVMWLQDRAERQKVRDFFTRANRPSNNRPPNNPNQIAPPGPIPEALAHAAVLLVRESLLAKFSQLPVEQQQQPHIQRRFMDMIQETMNPSLFQVIATSFFQVPHHMSLAVQYLRRISAQLKQLRRNIMATEVREFAINLDIKDREQYRIDRIQLRKEAADYYAQKKHRPEEQEPTGNIPVVDQDQELARLVQEVERVADEAYWKAFHEYPMRYQRQDEPEPERGPTPKRRRTSRGMSRFDALLRATQIDQASPQDQ